MNKGMAEKAWRLLERAKEILMNAELLLKVERIEWRIVEINVHIDRIPNEWDFLPIGRVFVESKNGYLAYPSNDQAWKLSAASFWSVMENQPIRGIFSHIREDFNSRGRANISHAYTWMESGYVHSRSFTVHST